MHKTKTLYLLRHAKSSWRDDTLPDRQRPLNTRGQYDAPVMARRLSDHIHQADDQFPSPTKIISSPAIRAHTTACIFGSALSFSTAEIQQDERLYSQGIEAIYSLILEQADSCNALMLVGHNPEMTELHNQLNGIQVDNMPTCAIATLHFKIEHWRQLSADNGSLVDFDFPKKYPSA